MLFFNSIKYLYSGLQIFGVLILIIELLYTLFQKPSKIQALLIVVLSSLIFSMLCYNSELLAQTKEEAYISCVLSYAGKPFAFLATLFLLIEYTNIKVDKWIKISIIVFFIFLSVMVFTNNRTNLYYSSVGWDETKYGSCLVLGHGPFWYVYMISSFLLFGFYVFIVVREFKLSNTRQARIMTLYLLGMVTSAMLGLFVFIMGWAHGYDTTLAGTVVGSIFLFILFLKFHFFDAITLGKEKAINDSNHGLVITDSRGAISWYNTVASQIVPELLKSGGHKNDVAIIDKIKEYSSEETIFLNDRAYKFSSNKNYAGKGNRKIFIGEAFSFDDITNEYNYQERLQLDIENATKRIKTIQNNTLITIANVIEARDGFTGTHVKNVATVSKLIAKEMSKDPRFAKILNLKMINSIFFTSPLHDVGKIYISDSILGKPDVLTPEEREIMKTHTTLGCNLIETSLSGIEEPEYIEVATQICKYHHEKWDGSGYPCGLKAEEIPLPARIVAIADVYDALRMKRPYKEAIDKETSLQIIADLKGKQFDPDVVDAFFRITNFIN